MIEKEHVLTKGRLRGGRTVLWKILAPFLASMLALFGFQAVLTVWNNQKGEMAASELRKASVGNARDFLLSEQDARLQRAADIVLRMDETLDFLTGVSTTRQTQVTILGAQHLMNAITRIERFSLYDTDMRVVFSEPDEMALDLGAPLEAELCPLANKAAKDISYEFFFASLPGGTPSSILARGIIAVVLDDDDQVVGYLRVEAGTQALLSDLARATQGVIGYIPCGEEGFAFTTNDELQDSGGAKGVLDSLPKPFFQEKAGSHHVSDSLEIVNDFAPSTKLGRLVATFDASAYIEQQRDMRRANTTGFCIMLLLSFFFMRVQIGRSVATPLRLVVARLLDISEGEGDLTQTLEVRSRDEIGNVATYFNHFVEKLRPLIGEVALQANSLADASSALSAISAQVDGHVGCIAGKADTMTLAAEESSASTTSVAAGMEQASANLESVAGATEEMSATALEIAGSAERARSISGEAMSQADGVTSVMKQLGEAAQEIGKVTETISDISAQTNLLALNATIEAARAGAAGKGFAVVAGEIKELARQTATATQDIKGKIEGIQTSTGSAMSDIEGIARVIKSVGEIVSQMAAAIEEQLVVTRDVAQNIAQASAGVSDANARVAQIAQGASGTAKEMAVVNETIGEIKMGGQQVQESATGLSALAEQLKEMVGKFKV